MLLPHHKGEGMRCHSDLAVTDRCSVKGAVSRTRVAEGVVTHTHTHTHTHTPVQCGVSCSLLRVGCDGCTIICVCVCVCVWTHTNTQR